MEFTELGLHPDLLDGIDALNFTQATPIQEQAIPVIMGGRDLIGVAQTGTGKTAAFVLPVLDAIMRSGTYNVTQALIIVPTRELAVQIDQAVSAYSYFSDVSSMAIYGGGDGKTFVQERSALESGADIIIATPGRLIAHIKMGYVDFSKLKFLVLDEADRMLDMGFLPDLTKIVDLVSKDRQTLLFSATMPKEVLKLAKSLTKDAFSISIALSKPAEGVTQGVFMVNDRQKLPLIVDLLKDKHGQRILIFSSTKQGVSKLFQQLKAKKLVVEAVSSDLEQERRESVMLAFRNRQVDIIVATDVLSRGIDIDGIDLVINYDIPRDAEDYVHRIGRTARAQRKGLALTFVTNADLRGFKRIEQLIGSTVPRMPLPPHIASLEADGKAHDGRLRDDKRNNKRPMDKDDRSRPSQQSDEQGPERQQRPPRPERQSRPEGEPGQERQPRPNNNGPRPERQPRHDGEPGQERQPRPNNNTPRPERQPRHEGEPGQERQPRPNNNTPRPERQPRPQGELGQERQIAPDGENPEQRKRKKKKRRPGNRPNNAEFQEGAPDQQPRQQQSPRPPQQPRPQQQQPPAPLPPPAPVETAEKPKKGFKWKFWEK